MKLPDFICIFGIILYVIVVGCFYLYYPIFRKSAIYNLRKEIELNSQSHEQEIKNQNLKQKEIV